MEHLRYDLGTLVQGSTVVVTLKNQANVQLMTSSDYTNYKAGRHYRYHGGRVTKSPFHIAVPSNGHWVVAIDLGAWVSYHELSVCHARGGACGRENCVHGIDDGPGSAV